MNAPYILIDLLSGNVLTDFASEAEAWQTLSEMAAEDGPGAIEHLSLVRMRDGQPTLVAMEDEIVLRVAQGLHQEAIVN